MEDLRLAESGLWARRCRVQRCDREIVDGRAALGWQEAAGKDAAGGTGSLPGRRRRRRSTRCLPGLPGPRPPCQPAPARLPPLHLVPGAGVAGKEATTLAAKHPDPLQLLCGQGPQLEGGGERARQRQASSSAALLLVAGQRCCPPTPASCRQPPGAQVCLHLPAQEVVGTPASKSFFLHIDQAACLPQTQSRPGRT